MQKTKKQKQKQKNIKSKKQQKNKTNKNNKNNKKTNIPKYKTYTQNIQIRKCQNIQYTTLKKPKKSSKKAIRNTEHKNRIHTKQ